MQVSSVTSARMVVENWERARSIYPIYLNLVHQFAPEIRACKEMEAEYPQPTPELMQRAERWFREADNRLEVHHIRELLTLTALEPSILQTVIARHIDKGPKNDSDRDKIDFLLVQYLAQSLPPNLAAHEPTLQQVSAILQPILPEATSPTPHAELEECARQLEECRNLREMLGHKILERGRAFKAAAQEKPFDAAALVPFARFSFLLRRSSIRLLHEEISVLETALEKLEAQGVTSVDCSSAGLDSQSVNELRWMCQQWKSYFRGKYSQNQWFSDVVQVGHCVEQALAPAAVPTKTSAADFGPSSSGSIGAEEKEDESTKAHQVQSSPRAESAAPAVVAIESAEPPKSAVLESRSTVAIEGSPVVAAALDSPPQVAAEPEPPSKTAVLDSRPTVTIDEQPAPDAKRITAPIEPPVTPEPPAAPPARIPTVETPAPSANAQQSHPIDSYINEILGQIKSVKHVRSSSVTAIKVGGVRLMLSSGEAEAFLKPAEGSAGIQHAVAVRALLLSAIEDPASHDIAAASQLAKEEMAGLDQAISEANKNDDTDRMVNLTACVRALQKALDKAVKSS